MKMAISVGRFLKRKTMLVWVKEFINKNFATRKSLGNFQELYTAFKGKHSDVILGSQSCEPWHCVKSVQILSDFWSVFRPNTGQYGPEITPYMDTFHAVWDPNGSSVICCALRQLRSQTYKINTYF